MPTPQQQPAIPSLHPPPTPPPVPPTEPDSLLVTLYPALAIVLSRASYDSLLALRTTCKAVRDAVDVRLMYHLQIRDDPTVDPATYLKYVRTPGGRIPAFMPREDGCWLGPVKVETTPVATVISQFQPRRAVAHTQSTEATFPLSAPTTAQRARCLELLGHTRVLDLIPVDNPSTFPWDAFAPVLDVLRVVPNWVGGLPGNRSDGWKLRPLRAHTIVLFGTCLDGSTDALLPDAELRQSVMLHAADKVVMHIMYALPGEYGAQYGLLWIPRMWMDCVGENTRELVVILSPLDQSYRDLIARNIVKSREMDFLHNQMQSPEIQLFGKSSPKARWYFFHHVFSLFVGESLARMTCTVVNLHCVPPYTLGWGSSTPSAWIVDEIESAVECTVLKKAHHPPVPAPVSARHVARATMARLTFLPGTQYMSGLTRAQAYGEGFFALPASHRQAFPAEYRHLLPGPQGPVVGGLVQPCRPLRPTSTHPNSPVPILLDWGAFPHIADLIIEYAPIESLMVLRITCRALRDRVESAIFRHITIAPSHSGKMVVSSARGRGPVPFFPCSYEGQPLRPVPPWLRTTRRRVLGLVRIFDQTDYSYWDSIFLSAPHNLDVVRVHPGSFTKMRSHMPSSTTLVGFTTPHGNAFPPYQFELPFLCNKVVFHILHREGQDTYGFPRSLPNPRLSVEFVLVFSPFKDQYHRMKDQPEPKDKTDGPLRYRILVTEVAQALSFNPLHLPFPDSYASIRVTMVNFHTVPPAWLGFETNDTAEIQAAITNDVRGRIVEVGTELKERYLRRWSPETWAEVVSLERLQWLTGHEYVARIPPAQHEIECTMEPVPGEKYRLLPEPSEMPETQAWTAPDPPCIRTAPKLDGVPSFFEDHNAWAWECPVLNVKELFEIEEDV